MHRALGARLAVPLLAILILAPAVRQAAAGDGCRPGPDGIVCTFDGTTTSTSVPGAGSLPPLRYLAVPDGRCWYWASHPPGLDAWDSANDQLIILTRLRLDACPTRPTSAPPVVASERAWRIFRSFPLERPSAHLTPEIGITNLPTRLHLDVPAVLTHRERLPDGRILEVQASVAIVWLDWGDGTPVDGVVPPRPYGDPSPLSHTFALKTCAPDYRAHHLDGPKCHHSLEAYPVTITFEWRGRYRTDRAWLDIGAIDRTTTLRHDVDEVLGVLVAP